MIEKAERALKLGELEERVQKWWRKNKIYEKSKSLTKGKKKVLFFRWPTLCLWCNTPWNCVEQDSEGYHSSLPLNEGV